MTEEEAKSGANKTEKVVAENVKVHFEGYAEVVE